MFIDELKNIIIDATLIEHNKNEFDNLFNSIKNYSNLIVVMESTSIYHLPVENYFRSKGIDTVVMNPIYRTKLATAGLLSVLLSASLLTAGCGTTAQKNVQTTVSKPIVKQLSEPSLAYLSNGNQLSSEVWMTIAKNNYEKKRYARA